MAKGALVLFLSPNLASPVKRSFSEVAQLFFPGGAAAVSATESNRSFARPRCAPAGETTTCHQCSGCCHLAIYLVHGVRGAQPEQAG